MTNKDFVYQRICNYSGEEFDPNEDHKVLKILRSRFNIHLPQRASINDALEAATSDHEIVELILQYRTMT